MLKQRIITAAILAAVFFAAMFGLPPRLFGALCLVALLAAVHEWTRLTGLGRGGEIAVTAVVFALGAYLLLGGAFGPERGFPILPVLIACGGASLFWVAVAPLWLLNGWSTRDGLAMAVLGASLILVFWIALVELHAHSPWLLLAVMAIVWIADTAAYFAGRRFGKRKLAPAISPGKSWEGVYGGLAGVGIYVTGLVLFSSLSADGPLKGILIVVGALLLACLSVVGDLFESWLKRQAGVKDSGTLLPGHGGVLDRIDALLPALPLATLFVTAMS
ncbi:MAG: phosphatidate cytidylyltransferase [Betaproteobacteria bacterium]